MKKKTSNLITVILILILLVGLSLLLYPTASDYWNSFHQSRAIATYAEEVANLDEERYDEMLAAARAYNVALAKGETKYVLTDEEREEYESLLDISGTGIMGYVEIPGIACSLPIYHGTDDAALQIAAGHLEWTSLPTGGANTHCVISGHRGLPSAKLFTDLDTDSHRGASGYHSLANCAGGGLLHAGDLYPLRDQHPSTAGAWAPH